MQALKRGDPPNPGTPSESRDFCRKPRDSEVGVLETPSNDTEISLINRLIRSKKTFLH